MQFIQLKAQSFWAFTFFLCASMFLPGCAFNTVYNPVQSATTGQAFLINQSALKDVRLGMTRPQVHLLMGQEIIIGYSYEATSANGDQPITIANPFKVERVKTPQGDCDVEYYATDVRRPDGVLSDDELTPLTFCHGILSAKGRRE